MRWLTVSYLITGKSSVRRTYNCGMSTQHSSTSLHSGPAVDPAQHLLILEDSDEIAEILQEIGRSAGYGVHWVTGRVQSVQSLTEYRPSVLLLNLGHAASVFAPPRHAEGLELLQSLAAQGVTAQIIIISGNPAAVRQSILDAGLALGLNMVAHIGKPFDIDGLEKQLLDLRQQ